MSIAYYIYRGVNLGYALYNRKKEVKISRFKKPTLPTYIDRVDTIAQHRILDLIQQFVKHKTLANLKMKKTFAAKRAATIAKFILAIGILYGLAKTFYDVIKELVTTLASMDFVELAKSFIRFCKKIQENAKLFIKEWQRCEGDWYIFMRENWSSRFNISGKIFKGLTFSAELLWDAIAWLCGAIWRSLKNSLSSAYKWLKDWIVELCTKPAKLKTDTEVRGPDDPDKFYKITDSKLETPLEGADDNDNIDLTPKVEEHYEDGKPSKQNEPSGGFKSVVSWAKNSYDIAKVGAEIMVEAITPHGGFFSNTPTESDVTVEDEENIVKQHVQSKTIEFTDKFIFNADAKILETLQNISSQINIITNNDLYILQKLAQTVDSHQKTM